MEEALGDRLINEKLVTPEQVEKALDRQKLHGGRLGSNLISLGFIDQATLDSFLKKAPPPPATLEDTGLDPDLIAELVLKTILFMGNFTMTDVAQRIKLPVSVVDHSLETLRRKKFCEVKGGTDFARTSYTFSITDAGKESAKEALELCQYVGPAPVSLEDYQTMVDSQTIKTAFVDTESIREAFAHLVVNPRILNQLGPAVNSGKSIFLYGPPGNGKTTIAETISNLFRDGIYIPYAFSVENQIIRVFDPINHRPVEPSGGASEYDERWVLCRRPVIIVGGELSMEMLDLEFNTLSKFYEAPLQIKANGGILIIDDFGRQLMRPRDLLNRWIVPLERRTDFYTLHTGKRFEVPFDELVVFSTNLDPKDLVDEAFLRRIRYKIEIGHPSPEEYAQIFESVCRRNDIAFKPDVVQHLVKELYPKSGARLNACHPRDLIDQIIDITRFRQTRPELTRELISEAWANYFVKL